MSVYLIADVKVIEDFWIPDYAANMHDMGTQEVPTLPTLKMSLLIPHCLRYLSFLTCNLVRTLLMTLNVLPIAGPGKKALLAGLISLTTQMLPALSHIWARAVDVSQQLTLFESAS